MDVAVVGMDVAQLEERHVSPPRPRRGRGRPRSPARRRWTSAGVPSAIFSPWSRTVTRSLMPMTTFMSCSISRIVRPSSVAQRAHEVRSARRVSSGFMPAVGSSSRSSLAVGGQRAGDLEPALVAVGQVAGQSLARLAEADQVQQLAAALERAALLAPHRRRPQDRLPTSVPLRRVVQRRPARSRSAVMLPKRRMFWNVRPMPSPDHLVGLLAGDVLAVEDDLAARSARTGR